MSYSYAPRGGRGGFRGGRGGTTNKTEPTPSATSASQTAVQKPQASEVITPFAQLSPEMLENHKGGEVTVITNTNQKATIRWCKSLVLQTCDVPTPVFYVIDKRVIRMSHLIDQMTKSDEDEIQTTSVPKKTLEGENPTLEEGEGGKGGLEEPVIIPLPNITSATLIPVMQYVEYHWNNRAPPIPKPLSAPLKTSSLISEWDKRYLFETLIYKGVERDHQLLMDVMMAANFLNISDLKDLCCAGLATLMEGKSSSEIRHLLHIANPFDKQQELKEQLREQLQKTGIC